MPVITGKLIDFGDIPMGVGAQVVFTPRKNGVDARNTFTTRPVVAVPGENGVYTASLRSSYFVRPLVGYTPSLRWLTPGDPDGGYTSVDYPNWVVYMPDYDCNFGDVVDTGDDTVNPLMVVTSPAKPPFIALNMFWLDTSNGGSILKRAELV
jgi:hypothetical protein